MNREERLLDLADRLNQIIELCKDSRGEISSLLMNGEWGVEGVIPDILEELEGLLEDIASQIILSRFWGKVPSFRSPTPQNKEVRL